MRERRKMGNNLGDQAGFKDQVNYFWNVLNFINISLILKGVDCILL